MVGKRFLQLTGPAPAHVSGAVCINAMLMVMLVVYVFIAATDGQANEKKGKKDRSALAVIEQEDPRGPPEVTLCSQNLNNLGDFALTRQRLDNTMLQSQYDAKVKGLVTRFINGRCDVIAVQELLGKDSADALKTLDLLAQQLRFRTGRIFEKRVGKTNDPISQVGFLVAADRAEILGETSYQRVELPKLLPKERPRFFLRGPLELQLEVKGREGTRPKNLAVVNFHLKSKGGRERDPAELEWETYRMQMAEALRRIVESRFESSFASGETLLALVGDRNSNFDAASTDVLSGALTLDDFKLNGGCRLSKRGVAFCQANKRQPARLFSLLQLDPQTKQLPGTFVMNKVYSWLDDIMVPQETLRFAWSNYAREGDYESFIVNRPAGVSDHVMVGATFNW